MSPGIQAVKARLAVAGDKKPRMFFVRGAVVEEDVELRDRRKPTSTIDEFPGYLWHEAKDGRPVKEQPVKENDHGVDGVRYMTMQLDLNTGGVILFEV